MATNYIQLGNIITVRAPKAVYSSEGILIGNLFGVATGTAEKDEEFQLMLTGVFELPKAAEKMIPQGTTVYWHPTTNVVTTDTKDTIKIGHVTQDTAAKSPTCPVRLCQ